MNKKFKVKHSVEWRDEMMEWCSDEETIGIYDSIEKAVKKIEELGGENYNPEDDAWLDPLADPEGYYWIVEEES